MALNTAIAATTVTNGELARGKVVVRWSFITRAVSTMRGPPWWASLRRRALSWQDLRVNLWRAVHRTTLERRPSRGKLSSRDRACTEWEGESPCGNFHAPGMPPDSRIQIQHPQTQRRTVGNDTNEISTWTVQPDYSFWVSSHVLVTEVRAQQLSI